MLFISVVGLLGVYSATYSGGISALFLKQLFYVVLGWFIVLLLQG
jgi:rod shape determining protein RodA